MINSPSNNHSVVLGYWLLFCAAMVYLMIVVGGITRLTQSGLSMVEWAPIMGIIPPLNEMQWLEVFEKYRTSPEYLKVNAGMSLQAFKQIFYWEYGHRVLGRVIGMIYLFPLLYFVARGMVPRAWSGRLVFLFVLGGLQGLMGWYMVKSGLVDIPRVSHYRLAAHFGLAVIIFSLMFWYAMDFLRGERRMLSVSNKYLEATGMVVGLVFLMMLSGAFVAGTKAGFIMNTFPTMNGQWLPDGLLAMTPLWRNLFDNAITVQFTHRLIAVLLICAIANCFIIASRQRFKTNVGVLVLLLIVQVSLGISALVYRVPVALGAAHQAGAVALLSAALYVAHRARKTA
ncbi:MAG: cytochrome c oxidase assembly protein subunit 15 [Cryomorphaceae bacterium]|jgi:cytochrome c oxidase assembly protein subunit 15